MRSIRLESFPSDEIGALLKIKSDPKQRVAFLFTFPNFFELQYRNL